MKRDRIHLLLYLAAVVTATLIHHPLWLGSGLLLVLLIAGREAANLLRRAVLTVLAFNTVISLSYLGMAWWQDISPWQTLLRLNLRVLLLTCLTFLFIARTNLFQALDFSKSLTYVLGLAYSQMLTFRRAHDDFRLALASRSLTRPSLIDRYRASAAAVSWFIEKSLHAATQSSQALRSRGFFHD
jgi:cobalt/nickel transport system permease protein